MTMPRKQIMIYPHGGPSETGTVGALPNPLTGQVTPSPTGMPAMLVGPSTVLQTTAAPYGLKTGMGVIGSVGGARGALKLGAGIITLLAGAMTVGPKYSMAGPVEPGAINVSQAIFGGGQVQPPGGDAVTMQTVMPYGIAGPGVPEPAAGTWTRKWQTKSLTKEGGAYWVYFWQMVDGYTICYNTRFGGWKRWKPRKSIVLSSDPRLSTIRRAVTATESKLKRLAKKSSHLTYKG